LSLTANCDGRIIFISICSTILVSGNSMLVKIAEKYL
jgi:hypothetical protein